MAINVIINGASGKMGQEAVNAINADPALNLVAQLSRNDNLADEIAKHHADVVVDLTVATVAYENLLTIIQAGAHPVIGTSGLTTEQISTAKQLCSDKKLGGIIVPNFSIGAVLMMQMSQIAAKHFQHVEIIEMHHDGKLDAPSGTAVRTAQMLDEARTAHHDLSIPATKPCHEPSISGSRGANYKNIPIHAIRLPGLVANQQVIFGGVGETLSITHNTIHRECFMPGVLLCCKKVHTLATLGVGLEVLL